MNNRKFIQLTLRRQYLDASRVVNADARGDSRRTWDGEVSYRVREVVLHAAASSRERAPTDAEMSSTQRRDRNKRGQSQRRSADDTRRNVVQHRDSTGILIGYNSRCSFS